jgi:hypothetical protein
VFAQYESVYSRNRVAVWFWIFESKGWVRFDERWKVTKEPTENDLDEVLRAYLQRHGNYDTPDDTCLKDILKREEGREKVRTPKVKNVIPAVKDQTEMSWPEMKKAYAQKRSAEKQDEPEKAPAPAQAYAGKAHRIDWDKILDGVRDILFDTPEPITATAIRRALGEHAPSLPGLIDQINQDRRFQSNDEKRWMLAKEEAPEDTNPKKKDDQALAPQW